MTMKSVDLPHLRSVVLAGHVGSGKTTLAEQLLFRAGAIPRLGRVDDGTAHLDFEPEEQKRRESLSLAVGTFESDGTRISLVDTPGYPDFVADVIEGFAAADGAIFVMDASAASRRGWRQAVALGRGTGTAACFFINKSDRENADPTAALDALRATFGDKIAPAPAGDRGGRVVQRLRRPRPPQGVEVGRLQGGRDPDPRRPDRRGRPPAGPAARGGRRGRRRRPDQVPRGRGDRRPRARGVPAQGRQGQRPRAGARRQRGQGHRPARRCSTRSSATSPPPPTRRRPRPTDKARRRPSRSPADENGPLLVRVFKTTADPFVGRLTYLRVLSGTLHSQAHVWNASRGEDERIGQLLLLHGKEQEPIGELKAGEIGAVAKLAVTETGDTLIDEGEAAHAGAARVPGAVARAWPSSRSRKGDLDKMGPALQRMLEEEPTVRLERSAARRAGPADDGRGPHRGHHRAAQAQVRRGDRDPHAEGPVQGDDPRQDPGPRPLQEADRRPRDVRGRLARARAEPGRRRRVRRAGRRRVRPEGVLRRRREGHPRGRGRGRRRRATRCPTSRRRSTTGRSTRSTRTSSRSRSRPRWRSRTGSTRRSRPSSSRS